MGNSGGKSIKMKGIKYPKEPKIKKVKDRSVTGVPKHTIHRHIPSEPAIPASYNPYPLIPEPSSLKPLIPESRGPKPGVETGFNYWALIAIIVGIILVAYGINLMLNSNLLVGFIVFGGGLVALVPGLKFSFKDFSLSHEK